MRATPPLVPVLVEGDHIRHTIRRQHSGTHSRTGVIVGVQTTPALAYLIRWDEPIGPWPVTLIAADDRAVSRFTP